MPLGVPMASAPHASARRSLCSLALASRLAIIALACATQMTRWRSTRAESESPLRAHYDASAQLQMSTGMLADEQCAEMGSIQHLLTEALSCLAHWDGQRTERRAERRAAVCRCASHLMTRGVHSHSLSHPSHALNRPWCAMIRRAFHIGIERVRRREGGRILPAHAGCSEDDRVCATDRSAQLIERTRIQLVKDCARLSASNVRTLTLM
jgi:hypothetical protein